MGISAGGGHGGPKSDINITPLVDVVLVMLVIFLLAMPIQIRKIEIQVPQELDQQTISISDAITVTILGKADGSIVINEGSGDTSITRVDLAKSLNKLFTRSKGKEVVMFVDFEDPVKYNDVISIMDTVRGAAPKRKVEKADGTSYMVPEVKIALKIRDVDRIKR